MKRFSKDTNVARLLWITNFLYLLCGALFGIAVMCNKLWYGIIVFAIIIVMTIMVTKTKNKAEKKLVMERNAEKEAIEKDYNQRRKSQIAIQRTIVRDEEFKRAACLREQIALKLGLEQIMNKETYDAIYLLFTQNLEELEKSEKKISEKLVDERKRIYLRVCNEKQLTEIQKMRTKELLETYSLADLKVFEKQTL